MIRSPKILRPQGLRHARPVEINFGAPMGPVTCALTPQCPRGSPIDE